MSVSGLIKLASKRTAVVAALVAMLLPATAGAQPAVSVESGNGNDQATAVTPLARPVDRGNSTDTLLVLDRLHSYGYTINTATRADRAIRSWQKSNHLVIDGIVGTQTLASLRLTATATAPAVRTTPPPVPAAVDSAAPEFDSLCDEMRWYRQQAGLPDVFDAIGYRESRCHNEVGNSCCHGWWANYLSSHLSQHSQYRQRVIDECGVTTVADIRGVSPEQKRASACVTFVVWSISGMSPWSL